MRRVGAVAETTASTISGLISKGMAMTGDLATGILTSTTFELPG